MTDIARTIRWYASGRMTADGGAQVCRQRVGETDELDPRLDLRNHSPTGFAWGYMGSGPAQLALAILADHLRDDNRAMRLYQDFKADVISHLDIKALWTMNALDVDRWLSGRAEQLEAQGL